MDNPQADTAWAVILLGALLLTALGQIAADVATHAPVGSSEAIFHHGGFVVRASTEFPCRNFSLEGLVAIDIGSVEKSRRACAGASAGRPAAFPAFAGPPSPKWLRRLKASSRLRAEALRRASAQTGRHFSVLTYQVYAPRVKMAVALLDGLF